MLKNRKMILKTLKTMPLFLIVASMLTIISCAKNDGGGSGGGGSSSAPVNVTGVTLAPASISTVTGKQWTLSATVSPANATDKSVTWESSDSTIVTVQAVAGKTDQAQVTTLKKGTATITVTTNDGAKEAIATIKVIDPVAVNSVTIDDKTIANKNRTVEIPIVINPTNTTYADITCTSGDTSVFTVVADKDKKVCKVTTVDYGTSSRSATLTAKVTDESGTTNSSKIQDTATITVRKPVGLISVSLPSAMNITGKEINKDFTVALDPVNADIAEIACASSDETVFTVASSDLATKTCKLTSHKMPANANLTVTVTDIEGNQKTDTKPVKVLTVPPVDITKIVFNSSYKRTIEGNTETTQDEEFSFMPANGTPDTLECISSNENAFTATADLANKKCVVTTKAKGSGTLTAKVTDLNGNVQSTTKDIEVYIRATGFLLTRKSDGKVLSENDATEISVHDLNYATGRIKVGTESDSDIVITYIPQGANRFNELSASPTPTLIKDDNSEYKEARNFEIKSGSYPYIVYKGHYVSLKYSSSNKPKDGDVFYLQLKSPYGLTAKVKFKVKIPVEQVALGKIANPVLGGLKVGDSVSLSSVLYWGSSQSNTLPQPGNTNVTYTSSNPNVIKISGNTATAKAKGSATITVTTEDGNKTDTEDVRVFYADQAFTVEGVTFKMVSIPTPSVTPFKFPTQDDDTGTASLYSFDPWFLAESETTWGLYKKVRDWARSHGYTLADGAMGGDHAALSSPTTSDEQPVTKISWCDTAVFANALTAYYNAHNGSATDLDYVYQVSSSELKSNSSSVCTTSVKTRDKNGFRLPTSDEWELAARWVGTDKGSRTDLVSRSENSGSYTLTYGYYWTPGKYASGAKTTGGTEFLKYAWFDNGDTNTNNGGSADVSQLVKTKLPNALGLYDMTGNVWEWHDTKDSDGKRCNSGGSYESTWKNSLYISKRAFVDRTAKDDTTGFRLARTIK